MKTNNSQKRTVVYGSDGNDIELLRTSIWSVRKFLGDDTDIVVLSDRVIPEEIPEARIIDPTPYLSEAGMFPDRWNRKWPYATLYRLTIPLIPDLSCLQRVLYLDTDTLVVSSRISDLFERPCEGFEAAGVKDINGGAGRIIDNLEKDVSREARSFLLSTVWNEDAPNPARVTYVNGGVLMFYPLNIDRESYLKRLRWFWEAETRGRFKYLDQDFVNSMMKTDRHIGPEFDVYASSFQGEAYPPESCILHYLCGEKTRMYAAAASLGRSGTVETTTIVYATDGRDADRLRASIKTARRYIGAPRIVVLTRCSTIQGVDAELVDPSGALASCGVVSDGWNRKWPFESLFRLAMPLLPQLDGTDRVLYLDTDTLVRKDEIRTFCRAPSRGFEVRGVPDIECRQHDIASSLVNDIGKEDLSEIHKVYGGFSRLKTRSYINAGVMMMFLDVIRKNGLDWYRRRLAMFWNCLSKGKFKFMDQDFINVLMDVDASAPVLFNKFGGDETTDCVVQHFVGGSKCSMLPVFGKLGL